VSIRKHREIAREKHAGDGWRRLVEGGEAGLEPLARSGCAKYRGVPRPGDTLLLRLG
jgi:hypothetical protein